MGRAGEDAIVNHVILAATSGKCQSATVSAVGSIGELYWKSSIAQTVI